jgi:hypothetical protein
LNFISRRGRPVTAANDNDNVRALRAAGLTFREIADRLDIGVASAHRAISPERPKRTPFAANDNTVQRDIAFNGGCSTTSGFAKVTLARVPTLERPEIDLPADLAAEGIAA